MQVDSHVAVRAASEAGSILSDRMESAALAAAELLRAPMRCLAAGAIFIFLPSALLVLAPLVMVLLPLLLPIGFMLMLFGGVRIVYIVLLSREEEDGAPLITLTRAMASVNTLAQNSNAMHAGKTTPGESSAELRRRRSKTLVEDMEPHSPVRERRATDGTLEELKGLAATRGQRMAHQLASLLKRSVGRVTTDFAVEVELQLRALQRELQSWAGVNPNLKPYAKGHIGWLLKQETEGQNCAYAMSPDGGGGGEAACSVINSRAARLKQQSAHLNVTHEFETLLASLPNAEAPLGEEGLEMLPLPPGVRWRELGYLLIPGLLTKWYPLYMGQLRADMKRLGLSVQFSRIDTDQPVRVNAARLRHEILEIGQSGRKVVLLGHSKGAVDAAAALSIFPELADSVAALVSLQGPHGGSAIAHDLVHTNIQKSITLGAIEKLLRGCRHAVLDLAFHSRMEFLQRHPYPRHRVPTLCVATCDRRPSSLLKPTIDYVAVRYGEYSDGCVCQADAILPHCPRVLLDDMDHFGPAWPSFPATDRYDPARLWLTCVSIALRNGGAPYKCVGSVATDMHSASTPVAPASSVAAAFTAASQEVEQLYDDLYEPSASNLRDDILSPSKPKIDDIKAGDGSLKQQAQARAILQPRMDKLGLESSPFHAIDQ